MTTSLDASTVDFLLGFAKLCYHLVRTGNIKVSYTPRMQLLNVGLFGLAGMPFFTRNRESA